MARDSDARMVALEREIRDLAARVCRLPDRPPDVELFYQLLPAITCAEEGDYPPPDCCDRLVYPYKLEDGTFTEAAGPQTITYAELSAEPHGYFCQAPGGYLWEGSHIFLVRHFGRLWTMDRGDPLVGVLDDPLEPEGTAIFSVYNPDTWVDTTWDIEVRASRILRTGTIPAGKRGEAVWWPDPVNAWVLKWWEC